MHISEFSFFCFAWKRENNAKRQVSASTITSSGDGEKIIMENKWDHSAQKRNTEELKSLCEKFSILIMYTKEWCVVPLLRPRPPIS